jgi:hypothetical protein
MSRISLSVSAGRVPRFIDFRVLVPPPHYNLSPVLSPFAPAWLVSHEANAGAETRPTLSFR